MSDAPLPDVDLSYDEGFVDRDSGEFWSSPVHIQRDGDALRITRNGRVHHAPILAWYPHLMRLHIELDGQQHHTVDLQSGKLGTTIDPFTFTHPIAPPTLDTFEAVGLGWLRAILHLCTGDPDRSLAREALPWPPPFAPDPDHPTTHTRAAQTWPFAPGKDASIAITHDLQAEPPGLSGYVWMAHPTKPRSSWMMYLRQDPTTPNTWQIEARGAATLAQADAAIAWLVACAQAPLRPYGAPPPLK